MVDEGKKDDKGISPFQSSAKEKPAYEEILEEVLAQLAKEAQARGSFAALLTEEQRAIVGNLTDVNFEAHSDQFDGSKSAFFEAMAKNYLAKTRAFTPLIIAAGYELHVPVLDEFDRDRLNKCDMAALTLNGSYLLTGVGALDSAGGASLIYKRIPLRSGERVSDISQDGGAFLLSTPKIGSRQLVETKEGNLRTSPLTHIFARESMQGAQTVEAVSETINASFHTINRETLFHD